MSGALEAKLVITAEDRTKAAFDAILAKLDKVFERAIGIDRAARTAERAIASTDAAIERVGRALVAGAQNMDRAARAMDHAAAAMKAGAAAAERVARIPRPEAPRHGFGGGHAVPHVVSTLPSDHGFKRLVAGGGFAIGGIGGAVAGVAAYEGGKFVVEESADRQHERVREDISGMSPTDREDAERRAAILAAQYPQVDQTAIMHTLRNARSVTGSYEEAASLSNDLLRTRIVAQAARPGQDVESDFDKLIKGLEQYGVTQDPRAFHEAMKRVQKVLAVEGDTLTADSIYQSFKYTRQALPGTSQRFMLGTAPALSQEMGGSSFGNALSSFNQAVVQGRMNRVPLKLAMDLGLIDKADLVLDQKGEPQRVKTPLEGGQGFKDWRLAKSDPDLWIWGRLQKALEASGTTDPAEITKITSTLFGNRMAGDFVGKIITQRARIEKNQLNLANAPDDPASRIMAGDPIAAWKGVENSFSNLAAAIPVSGTALTGALNSLAAAINDRAAALQGVKTDHARIEDNKEAYNIASAQDLTKMPSAQLAELKSAALADLGQKILAKKLEMKGVQDQIDEQAHMGWGEYLSSGRDKLADAMLPFRMKNLRKEMGDLDALLDRLNSLGQAPAPITSPDLEHDRIIRAATGGAVLAGPFGSGVVTPHVDVSGTLQGQMESNVKVEVTVKPSSDLIKAAATAQANARGNASAAVGNSMPEARPDRGLRP